MLVDGRDRTRCGNYMESEMSPTLWKSAFSDAVLFIAGIIVFVFFLIVLIGGAGCTPASPLAAAVVAPTGTNIDKADAYVNTAEYAIQQTIPHADVVGKGNLDMASNSHRLARSSLGQAKSDLSSVQSAVAEKDKQIETLAGQVTTLENSIGHRVEIWIRRLFWILVGLLAIHFIAGLAAILFPGAAPILGTVAKIVNPPGWFTWLIELRKDPV